MAYSQHDIEKIYKLYYPKLFGFARNYIPTDEDAENIVQDVFLILWEKRNELVISYTLTSWLFTLVKNKCLNFLRHKLIEEEYKAQMQEELSFKLCSLEALDYSYHSEKELEEKIRQALDALPERCRAVFVKSRIEGMKYKEIAEELGISVNTVENQMATALKKLRIALKDFLPLFLFLVK
jgi:RNA polymerase sigma-70 factor (ECF subfamily)